MCLFHTTAHVFVISHYSSCVCYLTLQLMCLLLNTTAHVFVISHYSSCVCYFTLQLMCLLFHTTAHVFVISHYSSCVCYFTPQLTSFISLYSHSDVEGQTTWDVCDQGQQLFPWCVRPGYQSGHRPPQRTDQTFRLDFKNIYRFCCILNTVFQLNLFYFPSYSYPVSTGVMGHQIDPHHGPIELFLSPASDPQLV